MVVLDLCWWVASARIAKRSSARIAVAIFALAQLAGLIWLLAQRFARAESTALFSKFALANVFIWHMILLPLLLLLAIALLPILAMLALVRTARRLGNPAPADASGALNRRQFLCMLAGSPLVAFCAMWSGSLTSYALISFSLPAI